MSTAETVRDLERFTIDAGHDKTSAASRSASSVSLEPARPRFLVPSARPAPVPGARPTPDLLGLEQGHPAASRSR